MLNETSRFQLRESVGYRVMGASLFELACRLGWLNLVARDGETLEGIYAFYHPTFQEYFAALAVEDWHFFLNHIPPEGGHGDTASTGVYRIFEKQWKEVILLWLGREEVGKEKKEGFINRLVEFEDGCGDFYNYRAYFLAAAGIAEFKDCSFADEIVSQVIKWGFGYFNEEKKEWQTYSDPIAEGSRDILKETDRGQCAIYHLVELMCTSQIDKDTQIEVVKELAEIGGSNPVAMSGLVELIGTSEDDNTWRSAINSLGKIDKDNSVAISALVDLIGTFQDKNTQRRAAVSLGKICKDNVVAIATLVDLIRNSDDNIARWQAADILGEIIKGKHFVLALSGLKDCLNSEVYENDFNRYKDRYPIIWVCAQNMTYPDFYQAWHTQPTNSPIPDNHRQNTDIPTLLKQLQSTDKTFPVPLNIRALEGETDISAIAQELCTQLYQAIFPTDTDIPAIRNAPEFKRLIPQLKNRLQKPHIALILHSCPCENALSSFTRKLADSQMGIHIAWITDTPLELPLTGFAADGEDVLEAVQDWIGGIGA
ncbi:HEAT repeat domain-containing protein [Microcoleus sp. PH2017_29_MFU_D_A]|uniref:NACHT C-terminal alpha/beta 1 domain-containing protein n=2 Tax=unclassified Microcoleus TaxID=2642155 RepID=UPI0034598DE7